VHDAADPVGAIAGAEAIVVSGGNTFALLAALYDRGLLDAMRRRVRAGAPYIGWSAGANLACPTIRTTNDMPIVQPPSFAALGLVPFQINPHFTDALIPNHGGETRSERLEEFLVANPEATVVGLREGTMLRVEGDTVMLVGDKPARVFRSGREPEENEPGPLIV
jgi:dipeptidase E